MTEQPGHQGARLYRCIGPADFRIVTIASWADDDAFGEASVNPRVGELVAEIPFDTHIGIYEVIRR